ncbi:hypothetical protein ACFL5P_01205 [candidate division KSB1 bacterium]
MIINDILSLHMKKGGWFCHTKEQSVYWINSSMEDSLLMISLYLIAPQVEGDDPFAHLKEKAKASFKVILTEHGIDTNNENHITKQDIQSLYIDNMHALSKSNVKLVGLRLGGYSFKGIGEDPLRKEFLETIKKYNLNNVEYCETVFGRFWGSFDNKPREYKGKVVPEE